MRKFNLIFLLILFPAIANAAAPTRSYNYVAHTTIDPAQNNTNENALYSYLQAGVDTYASGTITNDAISGSAAIGYSKLNLIGSIVNADISASAGIVGSKLNLTSSGAIGSTVANTGAFTTLTGTNITASTSLTSSTATVLNGTVNLGPTHQGDIFYDNGTSVIRLTPGTSGLFLKTQGASANPAWANQSMSFVSNTSVSGAATTGNIAITNTKYYKVIIHVNNLSGDDVLALRFNADSSSGNYLYSFDGRTTGGAITGGSAGAQEIALGTSTKAGSTNSIDAEILIYPQNGTTKISINGKVSYINAAASLLTYVDVAGLWPQTTATSFSIVTTGSATFTGNVLLYELSQS